MDCCIYLIEYVGQTESAYTWCANSYDAAVQEMRELKKEYPDRQWGIVEKDVS